MKEIVIVKRLNNATKNISAAFKDNAPFINCISNINSVLIHNVEDLDVVMPMYNLLEYSKITKKKEGVCGIITEMNQVIFFLLILNLPNARQVLRVMIRTYSQMQYTHKDLQHSSIIWPVWLNG